MKHCTLKVSQTLGATAYSAVTLLAHSNDAWLIGSLIGPNGAAIFKHITALCFLGQLVEHWWNMQSIHLARTSMFHQNGTRLDTCLWLFNDEWTKKSACPAFYDDLSKHAVAYRELSLLSACCVLFGHIIAVDSRCWQHSVDTTASADTLTVSMVGMCRYKTVPCV